MRSEDKIRLLAMDIDGTSLNDHKECTPRTQKALQALVDRGYMLVPTSGRVYKSSMDTRNLLPVSGIRYVISEDGAAATDCETGEIFWHKVIPVEVAARFAGKTMIHGARVNFCLDDENRTRLIGSVDGEFHSSWHAHFGTSPMSQEMITEGMDKRLLELNEPVVKITFWSEDLEMLESCRKMAEENYPELNCFRCDTRLMEFTSCDTDKGIALKALADRIGVRQDEICAIGDNGNDIPMIKYAGFGVAMGNGIDEAKESADIVIGNNNEDGLAKFLEKYFLRL